MNTTVKPNITMLNWAIKRAGHDLLEFTKKFPNVGDWLSEKKHPTLKQLEDFSHKVHLPFGYLFLDQPPQESLSFPFFRTGRDRTFNVSLNVYDTITLLQKRQDWLVEYLIDNNIEPLVFVGKYKTTPDFISIVNDIRRILKLDLEWASTQKNYETALDFLSGRVEEAGIFVFFNSVVENNNSRSIDVEECRGFVLVEEHAPFMFVNSVDGKAAQLFTIAHELAHIWTGKSAGFDIQGLLPSDDPIEKLCDKVAAELLVPTVSFNRMWAQLQDISALAKYFKVSPIVLARRALDQNKISKRDFFDWYNRYQNDLKFKKDSASGGDFYATQKKRLGLRFAGLVNQAVKENQLLYRDAYKLTGLKGDTYQNFITNNL